MKDQQKKKIQDYISSYNAFDVNGMIKDLGENIVFENISNGKVNMRTEGLEAFKGQAETAKQYFRKRKQTVQNWQFNNSIVLVDIAYEATLDKDLPNGLKRGDTLELNGKSSFEFSGNAIIRITDES
ncbi:nuclear transport factor 2 family protein [Algoriphagus sp. Y33]|uniref:nuclear transport factor 2 family protein n=1 Tax=Algoriphagus sp. Y33 TaxID=2772483 RepID=UPI001780DC31|nr:nuclear transport factor 2 family protein [Algoriphagus sp. Y33]